MPFSRIRIAESWALGIFRSLVPGLSFRHTLGRRGCREADSRQRNSLLAQSLPRTWLCYDRQLLQSRGSLLQTMIQTSRLVTLQTEKQIIQIWTRSYSVRNPRSLCLDVLVGTVQC